MPSLDSLVVDLQLNSATLKAGLKEAKDALAGFGEQIKGIGESLHALSEAKSFEIGKELVKELGDFVLKGAEAAAQMGELAAASGVPVKAFSEMAFAANLSGVSAEDFSAALVKLDKNIALAGGGAVQQASLFKTLGVSLTDASGHARSTEDIFKQLVDAFAGMEAGAGRTALMLETFGKAGAHLAEFMDQGTHSLEEIQAEAKRLGVSLTGESSEGAKAFNRNIIEMQAAVKGVSMQVAGQLSPSLSALTDALLNSKDASSTLSGVTEFLVNLMKVAATGALVTGAVFESVGLKLAAAAALIADAATGQWKAMTTVGASYRAQMEADAKKTSQLFDAIWNPSTEGAKKLGEAGKKSGDDIYAAFKGAEKGATELAAALKKAQEEEVNGWTSAMKSLTEKVAGYKTQLASVGLDEVGKLLAEMGTPGSKLATELQKADNYAQQMKMELLDGARALRDMAATQLALKVNFQIGRTDAANSAVNAQRTTDFQNIGADPSALLIAAKGHFKDFGEAMTALAAQTHSQAVALGAAETAQANGDLAAARSAQLSADEFGRAAVASGKAVAAFEEEARQLATMGVGDAISRAAMGLAGKMGDAGQIIVSGVQGFKEGGIWGAIIGVIGELLSRLKVFTDFSDMLNKKLFASLSELNTALEPLFTALTAISDALRPVQVVIHTLIDLVLKALQPAFEGLAQVFGFVGETLKPLGQIFGMIGTAVQPVFKALSALTSFGSVVTAVVDIFQNILPVMQVISAVFKIIGATLNFGTIVIEGIVLGLMRAAQEIMAAFGQNVTELKKSGDDMEKKLNDSIDQQKKFDLFKDDAASTLTDTTAAVGGLGDTVQKVNDKFSELLTNLPSGYKLGAAIFGADNGSGGIGSTVGPSASAAWGAAIEAAGQTTYRKNPNGAGRGTDFNDTVSQDQTSESTRPGGGSSSSSSGGIPPPPLSSLMLPGMTAAEQSAWGALFTYALGTGTCTVQQAADYANNAILGARGRSSSSSAATAGGSGGVTNIGGGGGGIQQTAPAENHYHFHEGSILPRDFGHFVEQVSEKQRQKEGQKHRNPTRTKR